MSEVRTKLCELCEEQPATLLCAECFRCYCEKCNKYVHESSKKKDHKTENIPKGVKVDTLCPLHKDEPLKMFCVNDNELCCPMCGLSGPHKGHNLVKVSEVTEDNKAFSSSKELFEGALKCSNDLEKKITDAIDGIQKNSSSTKEKVSQFFKEAHSRLDAEEAAIMEELEEACGEAEEALQKILNELKKVREESLERESYLKTSEKINKLVSLTIAKEIEKQSQETEEWLMKTLVTGITAEWDDKKRKVFFTRHFINGVPVPKDVMFPIVYSTNINVAWDCDESKVNKDLLSYCVEMQKVTDPQREWKQVYRGKDKKCSIGGLASDTEYNVRVMCYFNNIRGWGGTTRVRTKKLKVYIDSVILSQEWSGYALVEKLREWCGTERFGLLYRGTEDGFEANDFHMLCDNKGKTLVLVKNTSGHVFGGFASISWVSSGGWKQAPGSFLFTLTNMHGIQPTKFPLKNENDTYAMCHSSDYLSFGDGSDLRISSNCNTKANSYTSFPYRYKDTTGKGKSIFTSKANTSDYNFQVQEIEVFGIG